MLRLIFPITALLIGVALLLLGSGLLNTLIALRGGIEGYDDSSIGFIMSGYFVGFLVGTLLALSLIQRIGHIRTFAFCAALASCSVLLHVMWVNAYAWFFLRVLTGAVLVILYTVIESWLNGQTPSHQRGRVFAVYMAVNLGSLALAQQLLRLDSASSFMLFGLSAILISVSLVPVTWTRLAQPSVSEVTRLKLKTLWQVAPVSVAGAFLSGLAMGAFWGLGAAYAQRIGLSANGVATFLSCAILGGAALQYPLGRYSDSHDRRKVLLVLCVGAALAALILALLASAGIWVFLAIALYGGMAFAVYPVAVAHLIDHLEPEKILSGGTALLLLHGVGAAIGPALAGQFMAWIGPLALPMYFMAMQTLLAVYTVRNLQLVKKEVLDYPVDFVPMVRTTPTALEMCADTDDFTEQAANAQ